ncbi:MAG: hypothetical protein IT464_11330 [Planctomycetes bacterium]|nr:hypothetical protein [Planctomycetota bacterium]
MSTEGKLTAVFEVSRERDVPIDLLVVALTKLKSILNNAAASVVKNQDKPEWLISSVGYASPLTVVARLGAGLDRYREPIFAQVHRMYRSAWASPSNDAERMVDSLRALRNGTITNMYVVDTGTGAMTTLPPPPAEREPEPTGIIETRPIMGRVVGKAQVLQSRKELIFWIFNLRTDDPVLCYVEEDQREWLDGILDKTVEVYGQITRDPQTGKPKFVRNITRIDEVEPLAAGTLEGLRGYLEGHTRAPNGT